MGAGLVVPSVPGIEIGLQLVDLDGTFLHW